jgi:hypothetical protein
MVGIISTGWSFYPGPDSDASDVAFVMSKRTFECEIVIEFSSENRAVPADMSGDEANRPAQKYPESVPSFALIASRLAWIEVARRTVARNSLYAYLLICAACHTVLTFVVVIS